MALTRIAFRCRTYVRLWRNRGRSSRRLEIGPGSHRVPGFETLDCTPGPNVDYLWDASKRLPFADGTFEVVYASHVLEHIPWYHTEAVLREWIRVLSPGGRLELWVPDGVKICQTWVAAEVEGDTRFCDDGWWCLNPDKDPCVWASGRIIYGPPRGYPSWHRALFSERYLKALLRKLGLVDVRRMASTEVRSYDHGWINLGVVGRKPEGDNGGDAK